MFMSRAARMGVIRPRRSIRNAQSTFSAAWYFTAKTAESSRSTERKSPVFRFRDAGSRTSIFRRKEALPRSTLSPRMVPAQPPSS